MPKQPLFPHIPKRKEPQFPHVTKGQSLERLPQTRKPTRDDVEVYLSLPPFKASIWVEDKKTEETIWKLEGEEGIERFGWKDQNREQLEERVLKHLEDIGMLSGSEVGPAAVIPTGSCYQDAWRFLIKEEEGTLVHGSVQTIGKRINHAWVELPTGFIWEPESAEFMKKASFYGRAQPEVQGRYTVEQAAIMAARTGSFGPWAAEERGEFLLPQTILPEHRHLTSLVDEPLPKDAY